MEAVAEGMDAIREIVANTRSESLKPFLAKFDAYLAINIASFKVTAREDQTVAEFRFEFFDGSVVQWSAGPPRK